MEGAVRGEHDRPEPRMVSRGRAHRERDPNHPLVAVTSEVEVQLLDALV